MEKSNKVQDTLTKRRTSVKELGLDKSSGVSGTDLQNPNAKESNEMEPAYAHRLREKDNPNHDNTRGWRRSLLPLLLRDELEDMHPHLSRPFIQSGYLTLHGVSSCRASCLSALCRVHNETGNIYTHLLPAAMCIAYLFYHWIQLYLSDQDLQPIYEVLMSIFLISMSGCFMCSALYHIARVGWPQLYDIFLKIDLFGIWFLVLGSFVCGLWFGFECHPFWRYLYLIFFGGGLLLIIPLWFIFPHLTSWHFRQSFMVTLIGCGIIPATHWFIISGWDEMKIFWFGPVGMTVFYGMGFILFFYGIPERFAPGKFDFWLHSHQLWHLCVVAAAFSWWLCLEKLVWFRHTPIGMCPT